MGSSRWVSLVAAARSANLAMTLVSATGMYDATWVVSIPSLGMGMVFKRLQVPGTMPEEIDRERGVLSHGLST